MNPRALCLPLVLGVLAPALAQENAAEEGASSPSPTKEIEALRRRLAELERRLAASGEESPPSQSEPARGTPASEGGDPTGEGADESELDELFGPPRGEDLDAGTDEEPDEEDGPGAGVVDGLLGALGFSGAESEGPSLTLRGFGHASFDWRKRDVRDRTADFDRNAFAHGGLDLFLNSRLNDYFSFLAEVVFETGDEEYVLDVERVLIRFRPRDWFSAQAGRFHTSLGYWNTAFHHGEYLQTSIGRPRMFDFEDDDGILPVHMIGPRFTGTVVLGDEVEFRYFVEFGNGRGPVPDPPQFAQDADDPKAANVALHLRWRGLRLGGNGYVDTVPKNTDPAKGPVHERMRGLIAGGFLAYLAAPFELIAEYQFLQNDENHAAPARSHGYYVQIAIQLGSFKPYARYDALDISNSDRYFTSLVDVDAFTVGLRWDPASWVALKAQGSWAREDGPGRALDGDVYSFAAQCAFAF